MKVYGLISARKFKVTANSFPDYVFVDDYNLWSLKEVENFIKFNKHLPGLPSIDQVVSEGGFSIDEIQLATLEKTEELFLYIIELEKRVLELEKLLKQE